MTKNFVGVWLVIGAIGVIPAFVHRNPKPEWPANISR